MAPPRGLTPSGLVLVDKPAGPSSFAVVRELRSKTGARAGHAGTLDPFATGLLLVLLGRFTKKAQRFVGLSKEYEVATPKGRSSKSTSRPPRRTCASGSRLFAARSTCRFRLHRQSRSAASAHTG